MEAIVSYILQKEKYWDSPPVKKIRLTSEYKFPRELKNVFLKEKEEEKPVYLCTKEEIKKPWKRIKFEDKVTALAENNIITEETSKRTNDIFLLRNDVRIEKAANSDDDYTLESAKDAFIFLTNTFLKEIGESLGKEPDAEQERKNKPTLMSKLKSIQIDAPEDFAANLDWYLSGEKSVK
jgi:hypothetical protein